MAAKELPKHFSTKLLADPDNPLGKELRATAEILYDKPDNIKVPRNLGQNR